MATTEHGRTVHRPAITVRTERGVREVTGAQVKMWWWDQVSINLVGEMGLAAVEAAAEEDRGEELWRGQKVRLLGQSTRKEYK